MYQVHWGLREKPFENTPDPRFLYRSPRLLETYARQLYALREGQGAVVLCGDTGCGKTLLTRALLHELDPSGEELALLSAPSNNLDELLDELLYQLGEETANKTGETSLAKRRRLDQTLFERFAAGHRTTVVIDEAQRLDNDAVFEELRLLLNLQLNDAFLLNLLLVGHTDLDQTLRTHPALEERIAAWGMLSPLAHEEIGPYIQHRLEVAGRSQPVFAPEAIELIGQYSGGIPRRLNRVCDLCLAIGFNQQSDVVDEELAYRLILSEENNRV
jgi:general secretion pathway protein A